MKALCRAFKVEIIFLKVSLFCVLCFGFSPLAFFVRVFFFRPSFDFVVPLSLRSPRHHRQKAKPRNRGKKKKQDFLFSISFFWQGLLISVFMHNADGATLLN